jgi:hypothetical protein
MFMVIYGSMMADLCKNHIQSCRAMLAINSIDLGAGITFIEKSHDGFGYIFEILGRQKWPMANPYMIDPIHSEGDCEFYFRTVNSRGTAVV